VIAAVVEDVVSGKTYLVGTPAAFSANLFLLNGYFCNLINIYFKKIELPHKENMNFRNHKEFSKHL
jgi:hypothetical protein